MRLTKAADGSVLVGATDGELYRVSAADVPFMMHT